MNKPLENEIIIITGASRGIGAATALECANRGAKVVLVARSKDNLEAVTKDIIANGGQAVAVACDVTDYSEAENIVKVAVEQYGTITGLINNAGVIEPIARLEDSDAAMWAQVIQINLVGAYHWTRAVLPHFHQKKAGVIISLSSGAAHKALEGWSAYCASKAGLAMLTKSIALETSEDGICVYGFAPGLVDTEMQGRIRESGINAVSRVPQQELSSPHQAARAIAWLCQHKPSDINGQELDIRNAELRSRMGLEVSA